MVSLALAAASTIITVLIKEATPNPGLFTVNAPLAIHNLDTISLNTKLEAHTEEAKPAMAPSKLPKLLKHKRPSPSKRLLHLQRPVKSAVVSASHALLVLLKILTKPEDLPAVVEDGELPELPGLRLE